MKNRIKSITCIFIIALFVETVLFNYKFFLSLSNEPVTPEVYMNDGTLLKSDVAYYLDDGIILNINNINEDIDNVCIGVEDVFSTKVFQESNQVERATYIERIAEYVDKSTYDYFVAKVYITDDGYGDLYEVKEDFVSSECEGFQTIHIEPFGNVHNMQILLESEDNKAVIFNKITLNQKIGFDFNFLRFILVFFSLFSIYSFIFEKYAVCDYSRKKTMFKTILVLSLTAGALVYFLSLFKNQSPISGLNYQDLARSLLDGRVWIEDARDSPLSIMNNPYSPSERNDLGVLYHGDTAYYNGYYYLYFGITPALLLFLPYYVVTGQDLSYFRAEALLIVMICVFSFILVNMLRKRFAPNTPWKITMLLSVMMASIPAAVIMIKRVQIYYTAIATALMLVLAGLCIWMYSSELYEKKKGVVATIVGFLGSLCMALAVGARPQFAMASFLFLPLFGKLIREIKKNWMYLVFLLIPFVVIAAFLMWYNYVRFDSPFDFGANYNLTSYDMTNMGIHPSRMIPGIWYYLFYLPRFSIEFPYIIAEWNITGYPGYIFTEGQIGGAFMLIPISFILLVTLSKKRRNILKQDNSAYKEGMQICVICMICVIVIAIADTLLCGISMRYQMDFRIYILLAATIISFIVIKNSVQIDRLNNVCRLVASLGLVTMLMGLFTITAQFEAMSVNYDVCSYLRLKELFGLVVY